MECDLLNKKNILDYRDYKTTSTQLQGYVGMHMSGCIIKVAKTSNKFILILSCLYMYKSQVFVL